MFEPKFGSPNWKDFQSRFLFLLNYVVIFHRKKPVKQIHYINSQFLDIYKAVFRILNMAVSLHTILFSILLHFKILSQVYKILIYKYIFNYGIKTLTMHFIKRCYAEFFVSLMYFIGVFSRYIVIQNVVKIRKNIFN